MNLVDVFANCLGSGWKMNLVDVYANGLGRRGVCGKMCLVDVHGECRGGTGKLKFGRCAWADGLEPAIYILLSVPYTLKRLKKNEKKKEFTQLY